MSALNSMYWLNSLADEAPEAALVPKCAGFSSDIGFTASSICSSVAN
jgi:hypothetical protein